MTAQRRYALTGDWVPDLDRAVVTAAGQLGSVGAEADTKDHAARVPAHRAPGVGRVETRVG